MKSTLAKALAGGIGIFLLAGCSAAEDSGEELAAANEAGQAAVGDDALRLPVKPQGLAQAKREETDTYILTYIWPGEVQREEGLNALFEERLVNARAQLAAEAKSVRAQAPVQAPAQTPAQASTQAPTQAPTQVSAEEFAAAKHSLDVTWQVVSDLPRWLSLSASISTYAGGAHPNMGYDTLVWDRQERRALDPLDLFTGSTALEAAVSQRYCAELNRAREKRRGVRVEPSSDDTFDRCPMLEELTVLLGSSNGSTFDQIGLVAAPYVAGAYAEGTYEVVVALDETALAAVKPEYVSYFARGT